MPEAAFPDCHYRPDIAVFTVRWLTHELASTSPADYEALLLLPEALRTHRWLLDVRRRPLTSPAAAAWIIKDWLPRAAALLPAPMRLAYLVAPGRAQELAADTPLRAVVQPATRPGQPYELQTFSDEGEAMRWLLA